MIAVCPPEYFPRLRSLGLLMEATHFVLADTFQYRRQSFQNRSKLRNPEGWQWITIPLHGHQHGRAIGDVEIQRGGRWRERHWRAWMYNYRSTMYFEFFEDDFQPFFETEWTILGRCTCRSVELVADLLQVGTTITRASTLPGAPNTVAAILDAVEAAEDTLLVPEATAEEDAEAAQEAKTAPDVCVYRFDAPTYRQNFEGFEPEMSALDAIFNYGPDARRLIQEAQSVAPFEAPSAP